MFRFRWRLKTKLVLAISAMVVVLVATLSLIYVSRLVTQRVEEAYQSSDFVAHQIYLASRQALDQVNAEKLREASVDLNDPAALRAAMIRILAEDAGLKALLQSIVGYSPVVYDVAVTDASGRAVLHTDAEAVGALLPERESFQQVRAADLFRKLSVVYGAPRVYELRLPLEKPFGAVRVGLSTVFLKSALQPQLTSALFFSGLAVLVSLILAAGLSNFALRPLEAISRRLDLMTGAVQEPADKEAPAGDEYGVVRSKIDRLGRQMRDVQEVFAALKENLDQMMANLQDGVMLFTRDSRAVLVSASVEKFLGKPRSQMLGQEVWDIFGDSTELGRAVRDCFRLRRPLPQREAEAENGRRVQVALDFIEEGGERIGALLTLRDAESVRRIENEIELSRRLAAVGRLTAGVAHEVKNPVNAIVVHLEVLKQKLKQIDPDARRHMDVISSEIHRLDRVVETLVDFTRPVELRLGDADLDRVLEQVESAVSPEAEREGIRIERQPAGAPLPVRVDVDLVKQALWNVVINGVQAMPEGGVLRLRARRQDNEAVVEIEDQGGGIPQNIRDKIFNLYFTTKGSGSGIGLPMTYRVMQLHNGWLEFDTVEGKGTTFRMRFPLAQQPQAGPREVAAPGVNQ